MCVSVGAPLETRQSVSQPVIRSLSLPYTLQPRLIEAREAPCPLLPQCSLPSPT